MPSDSTKLFTGRISITNLKGKFIIGYRVKDGILITKLIKTQNQSTTRKYQKGTEKLCEYHQNGDTSCMFTDTELDEVVIMGTSGNNRALDPFVNEGNGDYEYDYTLDWNFGDGNPNGGGNKSTGCPTGQTYNVITGNCEIIIKPCAGDPVKNPEIAPQSASGVKGGMFGPTRKKWNKTKTQLIPLLHAGIDLKNPYGEPIYAMYNGTAILDTQKDRKGNIIRAGHMVRITSNINGKTVELLYFHMQQNNRKSGTVLAGDIIGYQGDSGNLKKAIKQGQSISHLHLKTKENGKAVDPVTYLKTEIDPNTGVVTKPCK